MQNDEIEKMEMKKQEMFLLKTINDMSIKQAKIYLVKYFFPLCNGDHIVILAGKYEIYKTNVIKAVYFNRMAKELTKFYFNEYDDLRIITYTINKPFLYDYYLNLCPSFIHTYKPYKDFDEKTKTLCNDVLKFVYEIWANNQKDMYEFILQWLSNMVRGNKNRSALYLKGIQRIGKSTFTQFLQKFVIGKSLCLETGSEPIKSRFNKILGGKLLVCFEELESFSKNEWEAISSRLKTYITADSYILEDKQENRFESPNINNYIILTNNDCIKDSDGLRYVNLDLSTKYYADEKYFNHIYNNCFNDEVGHAFYSYLLEVDITNYNAQRYPFSRSKLDECSKRLKSVELFIKERYVLEKKGIHTDKGNGIVVDALFEEYIEFCTYKKLKPLIKVDFCKHMRDMTFDYKPAGNKNKYNISYERLLTFATERHWLHELDNFSTDDTPSTNSTVSDETDYKTLYEQQQAEIEELKKMLAQLQKPQEQPKITIIEDDDDDDDDDDYYEHEGEGEADDVEELDDELEKEFKSIGTKNDLPPVKNTTITDETFDKIFTTTLSTTTKKSELTLEI